MEITTVEQLKMAPSLIKLLKDYIKTQYEADSDLNDENLLMEYNYLKDNNMLHMLFENEFMHYYFKNQPDGMI